MKWYIRTCRQSMLGEQQLELVDRLSDIQRLVFPARPPAPPLPPTPFADVFEPAFKSSCCSPTYQAVCADGYFGYDCLFVVIVDVMLVREVPEMMPCKC